MSDDPSLRDVFPDSPGDEVAYLIGRYRHWPENEIKLRISRLEQDVVDPEAARRNVGAGRSEDEQRRIDQLDLDELRRELVSRRD